MLKQLDIQNIALIDSISIELGDGLNILTGETGAGKSIIIDSINAILGERISRDLIRTGKEKAVVEAVFNVDGKRLLDLFENMGMEPEDDGTLILSREFSVSGRNVCRINGHMVTVSMLRDVGQRIIDVHGQHDNQSLLRTESHIELLDSFAGEKLISLKKSYGALLEEQKEIKAKLTRLQGDNNQRERKIDMYKYQIEEIRKARLKPGEDEELSRQRVICANSEKIASALSDAYDALFSGDTRMSASDGINKALADIVGIAKLDEKYGCLAEKLESINYQLEDIADEIRRERDGIEFSPEILERIEERMDLLFRLKKKYGNTIEEILEYSASIERELEELVKNEDIIKELSERLMEINSRLYGLALEMNGERRKASELLEREIGGELEQLEMKNARFNVKLDFDGMEVQDREYRFHQNGLDRVEFMISTNPGEPVKPLSKIASGGEMSRIMLAIKTILANEDEVPTLIFDEIDMGISGRAAQKVGEKLSYISKKHQVICVTHLAQIACMADHHFLIEKVSDETSTQTSVTKLERDGLKHEIARIIGGSEITGITLKHANEMLKAAQKIKKASK